MPYNSLLSTNVLNFVSGAVLRARTDMYNPSGAEKCSAPWKSVTCLHSAGAVKAKTCTPRLAKVISAAVFSGSHYG